MKKEDREALRAFYQTLAQGSFTGAQLELYAALQGDKDDRLNWVKKWGTTINIPPEVVDALDTVEKLTKADLAVLLAAEVARETAPKVQQATASIWAWKIWPWNWF